MSENGEQPALTKLSIAEKHITAAIQMIALRLNPYSIHLVVMAADELIESFADKSGILLPFSSKIWVREEFQKEWYSAKKKAVNYFKHADRDHDQPYAGPDLTTLHWLNDATLLACISGLQELKYSVPLAFNQYAISAYGLYPQICNWDYLATEDPKLHDAFKQFDGKISRADFEDILYHMLVSNGLIDSRD